MKKAKIIRHVRLKSKSEPSILDNAINIQSTYSSAKDYRKKKRASVNKYLEKIAGRRTTAMKAEGATRSVEDQNILKQGFSKLPYGNKKLAIHGAGVRENPVGNINSLLGYAKKLIKKASYMDNKYLEKIAFEGTILGPKARAKKVLEAVEAVEANKKLKNRKLIGKVGLISAAGIGGYYAGKALFNRKSGQEKRADLKSIALGAARGFGQKALRGAGMLPKQFSNVQAAATKRGIFSKQTAGALKPIFKNKAVQLGAGLVGAGAVGGAMLNKKSSENKYLDKIAEVTYQVAIPPGPKSFLSASDRLNLGREEYEEYLKEVPEHMEGNTLKHVLPNSLIGALIGGLAGVSLHSPKIGVATGALLGSLGGLSAATREAQHKALTKHFPGSSENKYLDKIAGMFGGFGHSIPTPTIKPPPATIGVRG